ncbi:LOW QUALITY PROTEIN: hypothetical protein MAR_028480 [Mya arenaria]|uniref:Uncharacterized protein n=1 Tax=Mya arenaria TaxID=6604 RepID=A0ABY7DGG8_MYAAR|nr:LOW QUALITY PROTEIN: hypothetical protein MAR_028480 [Mya arenaria]
MQPLDKGMFGPLKKQWNTTVRKHNRKHPGVVINKTNFAEKIKDCFNAFNKPCTISLLFIRHISRQPLSHLRSAVEDILAFSESDRASIVKESEQRENTQVQTDINEEVFNAYASVLSTPVKHTYENRLQENLYINGHITRVKTKLISGESIQSDSSANNQDPVKESNLGEISAVQLLADMATGLNQDTTS